MILGNAIGFETWDYITIGIYMLITIGMGVWFMRKNTNSEEYLLAGRAMPWWAVGISYVMSLLSTYSLVMVPGEIFSNGMSIFVLGFIAPVFSLIAFWIFVRFYFKLKSYTPFEYLERRYDKNVRFLIAVIYFFTRVLYLAMVLFATTKVFEGGAGWPAWLTILLVGFIGIGYTVMGGLRAVIWTDVFQFIVLFGGLGIAVVVCSRLCDGGIPGIISYALDHGRGPTRFAESSFYQLNPYVRLCVWGLLMGAILGAMFENCADQISLQRLLSTGKYKQAQKAIILNAALIIPLTMLLCFFGFAMFAFYSQNPDPRVKSGDTAFFVFISTQLPRPLPGLLFAAMLAAVMSTLDSGINSLSVVWLKELHEKYINPRMDEAKKVVVSRIATVSIGLFAMLLALLVSYTAAILKQSVIEAQTVFGAFGIVIVPAFAFAVFSRRANSKIVWAMSLFCWGINFGMIHWFWVSKQDPNKPITLFWVVFTLALMLPAFLLRLIPAKKLLKLLLLEAWLFPVGYGMSLIFWMVFVHYAGPGALSFQWVGLPGPVIFFGVGAIAIHLSKRQPKSKCEGLTLFNFSENE